MNIYLFLSISFIIIFLLGKVVEKFKIPWIFSSLVLGTIFSVSNPFKEVTNSEVFSFLANTGMYFLLFMIGLEIDLSKFKEASSFVFESAFSIIFLEGIFGALTIHLMFDYNFLLSFIIGLSFATVGEAIIIPILQEFRIVNTRLGQSIIGIGALDDIIELLILIMVIMMSGGNGGIHSNPIFILLILFLLFSLNFGLSRFKKKSEEFTHYNIENLFLFSLFVLFLYVGIGLNAEASSIAALLSGVTMNMLIPKERLLSLEKGIKTISYGFFAPIFFLSVGINMDVHYLVSAPLFVLIIVLVSSSAKILGSYFITKNILGTKESILLGIGLSVRFSTSLVIMKILLDNEFINLEVYSIIVASSIVFMFAVPILFSSLLNRWNISRKILDIKQKF